MLLNQMGPYQGTIAYGLQLADIPMAQGGWREYFCESDKGDLRIADPMLRAQTAVIMENAKRWMAKALGCRRTAQGMLALNEASLSPLLGGWAEHIFPILRAAFPSNAVNDIVSVQPTTKRTATIIYWNFVMGGNRAKGAYVPGQRMFDSLVGKQDYSFNFTREVIQGEPVGLGNGGTGPSLTALLYHDGGGIRPGTVNLTTLDTADAIITVQDDGRGGWLSGIAGTIDYNTGAIAVTWGANTKNSQPIIANYRYNSEGSQLVPTIDVQITTSTVETERQALRVDFSEEAVFDVMNELGISLEPNILSGCTEQLNCDIARYLVSEMWKAADVQAVFNINGPVEYSRTEHYQDFKIALDAGSNRIHARCQKGYGNWMVVDEGAATLVTQMRGFVAAPTPANVQGLHYIGTLNNTYRVYKDLGLQSLPNASAVGNVLMGFKGNEFYEAGLVWAPYNLIYTTDTLRTADFMNQKGLASRSAVKMVNPNMFVRLPLSNT